MTKQEYQEYLQSPHWKRVQYAMYHIRPEDCELCYQTAHTYNIHHIRYENIGNENFDDLVVLCERCHKMVHEDGYRLKRRNGHRLIVKSMLFDMMVYSGMAYHEAINELSSYSYRGDSDDGEYKIKHISECIDEVLYNMIHQGGNIYV